MTISAVDVVVAIRAHVSVLVALTAFAALPSHDFSVVDAVEVKVRDCVNLLTSRGQRMELLGTNSLRFATAVPIVCAGDVAYDPAHLNAFTRGLCLNSCIVGGLARTQQYCPTVKFFVLDN